MAESTSQEVVESASSDKEESLDADYSSSQLQEADELIAELQRQLSSAIGCSEPAPIPSAEDHRWTVEGEALEAKAREARTAQSDLRIKAAEEAASQAEQVEANATFQTSVAKVTVQDHLTSFVSSVRQSPATRRLQAYSLISDAGDKCGGSTSSLTVVGALLPTDVPRIEPLLASLQAIDEPLVSVRLQTAVGMRAGLLDGTRS